ncbi:MAG: PD40 domain-containing protein [Phycisphaeraceae bacterium]|nr:PD40 domain-containing protein [Phycisphaerales bacterium]MCB9860973.1 PD40 domain-containing protein [Phycisphaeraceae bacterium]
MNRAFQCTPFAVSVIASLLVASNATGQHNDISGAPGQPPLDWHSLEAPLLTNHTQLTSAAQFMKAGEAYFSPNMERVIFQAIPVPAPGTEPDKHYSMYVANFSHDAEGVITGLNNIRRLSEPGSSNTCGWFHPIEHNKVLFASTIVPPVFNGKAGYQKDGSRYAWAFPEEMDIVTATMASDGTLREPARARFVLPGYTAEASWSKDGRHILYAQMNEERSELIGKHDLDIWVYDTQQNEHRLLVSAPGYDGGPFFSPDGKRICYRSDRRGNDMLQVYVSDLVYNDTGAIVGTSAEYQLTDGPNVNWAPYWHPSGEYMVYASSEVGHFNYEVVAVRFDAEKLSSGQRVSDVDRVRITYANGADVLPVFSPDGRYMMWTAQRGERVGSEQKPSSQMWIADVNPSLTTERLFRFISEADALRVATAALEMQATWAVEATFDAQWNDLGWVIEAAPPMSSSDQQSWRFVLARDGRLLSSKAFTPDADEGKPATASHSYHQERDSK